MPIIIALPLKKRHDPKINKSMPLLLIPINLDQELQIQHARPISTDTNLGRTSHGPGRFPHGLKPIPPAPPRPTIKRLQDPAFGFFGAELDRRGPQRAARGAEDEIRRSWRGGQDEHAGCCGGELGDCVGEVGGAEDCFELQREAVEGNIVFVGLFFLFLVVAVVFVVIVVGA